MQLLDKKISTISKKFGKVKVNIEKNVKFWQEPNWTFLDINQNLMTIKSEMKQKNHFTVKF